MKRYLKGSPGALFILGFQLLLLICVGLLIQGYSVMASEVAVYAYYMLLAGVVLQLTSSIRSRKEEVEQK
jgi:hypothetical protein